jgi:hypothetical protein
MTLENCRRLLAHYEKIGNQQAAQEMRLKLETRGEPVTPSKGKK